MAKDRQSLRPLPHNPDAERSILGAILIDNNAIASALKFISSGDFFNTYNQKIFRQMIAMREAGQTIDLVTLCENLELKDVGGSSYVASLSDGIPRVANVDAWAKIVRQTSIDRNTMKASEALIRSIETGEDIELHKSQLRSLLQETGSNGHGLKDIDLRDFILMTIPNQEFLIEPILPRHGSGMIYSPTGAGKTYIGLYIAYCLSLGYDHVFVWNVPSARKILYIDGEMDLQTMQRRQLEIARGFFPALPDPGFFRLITPDLQDKYTPRINSKEGRRMIEDRIRDAELLFLDNLETLCPSGDEKSTDYWAEVQEWVLDLRRNSIGTIFFHHAGKSGTQLGTSKKEHQLYFNLTLRSPKNYQLEDGLKVIARLEKMRGRGRDNFNPSWVQPFEISLRTEWDGEHTKATFLHQPARGLLREQAIKMLQSGMHPGDIAADLGLDRYTIYRLKKKIRDEGIQAAETEE